MTEPRVLLIDDNDDQRSLLANALRARGWRVDVARTGRQGLERAQLGQPDLVLTELLLPDVRAFNIARSLRSMVEHDLRVIALTRLPEQMHVRALKEGFDLVQCKPFDADALHERMLALLVPHAS